MRVYELPFGGWVDLDHMLEVSEPVITRPSFPHDPTLVSFVITFMFRDEPTVYSWPVGTRHYLHGGYWYGDDPVPAWLRDTFDYDGNPVMIEGEMLALTRLREHVKTIIEAWGVTRDSA